MIWGTTEPITTSSSWSRDTPKRWKYWHISSPISSEVRLASVCSRKLPFSSSPS